jgi:hypothetical protein
VRNQTKGEEFDIIHPHRNKPFPFACTTHLTLTFCWKMRNLIINLYNLIYVRGNLVFLFCTIPFQGPAGSYSTYMASVCMTFYRGGGPGWRRFRPSNEKKLNGTTCWGRRINECSSERTPATAQFDRRLALRHSSTIQCTLVDAVK